MKSYKFIIKGKVQGVYYRKFVSQNAKKFGFYGYVKNLKNGDVEACVTTNEANLEKFINILKQGSPYSEVNEIIQSDCKENFTNSFEIRY